MKRVILHLLTGLFWANAVFSQTAADPNEGSRLVALGNNSYRFTWWARAGIDYLVEFSPDFIHWTYVNTGHVLTGLGGVSGPVILNVSGLDRLFIRLNRDPYHTDSDGDWMDDGWEFNVGLDPRANDALGNLDNDDYINLEEYGLGLNPFYNEYQNGVRTQTYSWDNANKTTGTGGDLGESFGYDDEGNLTSAQ